MKKSIFFLGVVLCITFGICECLSSKDHQKYYHASIYVETNTSIAETDDNYVCVTMDYSTAFPENHQSLLYLDLNDSILNNAVKAFAPLRLRLGGTLEDIVTYETIGQQEPCTDFTPNATHIFEQNPGCLPWARWDQLNAFFRDTGAIAVFGLNALYGKQIINGTTTGPWDSSNAESLIRHTFDNNYTNILGWELGNELSGNGVEASIPADDYAADVITLDNLIQRIYGDSLTKPIVLAPGGFFNAPDWFVEFFNKTTNNLQVITHHIYCLGPGDDVHILSKIFDPSYLDTCRQVFIDLQNMLRSQRSTTVPWVGEGGGAYHGGHNLVTNAFASGFWYLDQLGMAAMYNTKVYCRQTLVGSHYGLLNTTSFAPNPDYYSALLYHRLMGKRVLSTTVNGTPKLRAYAQCSKNNEGFTLLILNLDNKSFKIHVSNGDGPITGALHLQQTPQREEYHLTSSNGDLRSQTMLLNGQVLDLTVDGDIPTLASRLVRSKRSIAVEPYSIAFVQFQGISIAACNA